MARPPSPAQGRPDWEPLGAAASEGRLLEFMMPTTLTTVTPEIVGTVTGDLRTHAAGRGGRGDLVPGA